MSQAGSAPKSSRQRSTSNDRRERERNARRAEYFSALILMLKGYRILELRARTPVGEIDIVAVRWRRIAFVEVKQRRTFEACEQAVSPQQTRRMAAAVEVWLAHWPRYRNHRRSLDRFDVVSWRKFRHVKDALQPSG